MLGKSDTVTQFEIQIVKFTLNLKTPINFLCVFPSNTSINLHIRMSHSQVCE